ncbi:MAG: nicotinate-nucleotide adenylyltransferase [Pirellula sp.]
MPNKLGIFGGSFDPIHLGHLLLAELCRETLGLNTVKFVVANVSPLKTDRTMTSNRDRIEMVQLAIGGNPHFEMDTREIDRGGVSYSIDTARSIAEELPDNNLYLLMGSDVLIDIAKWRTPRELFQIVTPAVITRAGFGEPNWALIDEFVDQDQLAEIKNATVAVPQLEISSTDLKSRIRLGRSIRYQVPAAVETYIREHQLYR